MKRIPIKEIILLYKETRDVSETARRLGISRWTVKRWVTKGTSLSQYTPTVVFRGLKRVSTRPKTIHYKISVFEAEELIKIRKRKHIGARKLVYVNNTQASWRTIHRLLKRQNLVLKQVQYRRPRYQNGKAMRPSNTKDLGYLQMDTKHVTPELSGLPVTVYEYAAIDILSRYKLAVIYPS